MIENAATAETPKPRKGMPDPKLDEAEFKRRYTQQFYDPAFQAMEAEIARLADIAWDAYDEGRKSPITRKAGKGYADPAYDLSVEWLAAKEAIEDAQRRFTDASRSRVLIVNASSRSEHTCPGEMSKSYRMTELARAVLEAQGVEVEVLDLSRLASEYGRQIHPCKACYSTAAALCHWPCSCYPNHSLGQTADWMNEIYPMWVAAHGVLLITPVNWYSPSSPLKLLMDRLVCADGGNPDPTATHGKKPEEAKALELKGWHYPRHLEGRQFGIIVHGDTEGAENTRRGLVDWLVSIKMVQAGPLSVLDRYIGYWEPYANNHLDYEKDEDFQGEVKNVARSLAEAVNAMVGGELRVPGADLEDPRQK